MELGAARHANRCRLKVLADGDLKNGLTPLPPEKKREKVQDSSKEMITFARLIHARGPEGDPCLPSVCERTSARMSAHAYQIHFLQISIHFSSFIQFVLQIDS